MRAELADAAMRLLEREGLPAISVRRVAGEAGVTPGYLRHYYPTQVDLERALTIRTTSDSRDRILPILRDQARDGRDRARAALAELLPLDRRRRLEAQVAYRFVISAGDLPDYRNDLALLVVGMRSVTRFAVAEFAGVDHGWRVTDPLPDPVLEQRTEILAEIIDGISLYGMQTPSASADDLLARLDVALDWIVEASPRESADAPARS